MSLGIFSFDLAAIINSLSNFIATDDASAAAAVEMSLYKTEDVLQMAAASDTLIDDVLMAAALTNAVTSVISEAAKRESSTESPAVQKTPARAAGALDEETRKEIERLIKSLQTSVIHNYKTTDMIDESVSLTTVSNFARRNLREDTDDRKESTERQKKSDEQRLETLREELKRAILKNNSDV